MEHEQNRKPKKSVRWKNSWDADTENDEMVDHRIGLKKLEEANTRNRAKTSFSVASEVSVKSTKSEKNLRMW